jgi:hypothetical protein
MENTLKEKICEKQKEIDNLENEIANEIKENFTEVKDEIMAHCTKFEEIKKYNKKVIEDFYQEFNESS